MHAKDNLSYGLREGVEFALWVVPPMAIVREVPRQFVGLEVPTEQLLASVDGFIRNWEGHKASLAGGIEH
jgi:hypothetical protein